MNMVSTLIVAVLIFLLLNSFECTDKSKKSKSSYGDLTNLAELASVDERDIALAKVAFDAQDKAENERVRGDLKIGDELEQLETQNSYFGPAFSRNRDDALSDGVLRNYITKPTTKRKNHIVNSKSLESIGFEKDDPPYSGERSLFLKDLNWNEYEKPNNIQTPKIAFNLNKTVSEILKHSSLGHHAKTHKSAKKKKHNTKQSGKQATDERKHIIRYHGGMGADKHGGIPNDQMTLLKKFYRNGGYHNDREPLDEYKSHEDSQEDEEYENNDENEKTREKSGNNEDETKYGDHDSENNHDDNDSDVGYSDDDEKEINEKEINDHSLVFNPENPVSNEDIHTDTSFVDQEMKNSGLEKKFIQTKRFNEDDMFDPDDASENSMTRIGKRHTHFLRHRPRHTFHQVANYDNPCENGGIYETVESGMKACVCPITYMGKNCQDFNYCYNEPCNSCGKCQVTLHWPHYTCECCKEFYGEHCQLKNPCEPNPCSNLGTCSHDGQAVTCICKARYKGKLCNEYNDCEPNPCQNEGICVPLHDGNIRCDCTNSWSGKLCEVPNTCQSDPCQNGATCADNNGIFKCTCTENYHGDTCSDKICSLTSCLNGGTCIVSDRQQHCICPEYATGEKCEDVTPCLTKPCQNGGTCIDSHLMSSKVYMPSMDYYCMCRVPYSGKHCEADPCVACDSNAHCHVDHCVCNQGYKGDGFQCNNIPNPCHPNPCLNDGSCMTVPGGTFKCVCKESFLLPLCKVRDVCIPNPCNSGACITLFDGSYTCDCQKGYSGARCNEIDPCGRNPCIHNGKCVVSNTTPSKYSCVCVGSWHGDVCQECNCKKSTNPSLPDSFCHGNTGECICPSKFIYSKQTGSCEINEVSRKSSVEVCLGNPCLHNGMCIPIDESYDCRCTSRYTGPHCEVDKCLQCDDNANCFEGRCQCAEGYVGNGYHCEKTCLNGCGRFQVCTSMGECECYPGYEMLDAACHRYINTDKFRYLDEDADEIYEPYRRKTYQPTNRPTLGKLPTHPRRAKSRHLSSDVSTTVNPLLLFRQDKKLVGTKRIMTFAPTNPSPLIQSTFKQKNVDGGAYREAHTQDLLRQDMNEKFVIDVISDDSDDDTTITELVSGNETKKFGNSDLEQNDTSFIKTKLVFPKNNSNNESYSIPNKMNSNFPSKTSDPLLKQHKLKDEVEANGVGIIRDEGRDVGSKNENMSSLHHIKPLTLHLQKEKYRNKLHSLLNEKSHVNINNSTVISRFNSNYIDELQVLPVTNKKYFSNVTLTNNFTDHIDDVDGGDTYVINRKYIQHTFFSGLKRNSIVNSSQHKHGGYQDSKLNPSLNSSVSRNVIDDKKSSMIPKT